MALCTRQVLCALGPLSLCLGLSAVPRVPLGEGRPSVPCVCKWTNDKIATATVYSLIIHCGIHASQPTLRYVNDTSMEH